MTLRRPLFLVLTFISLAFCAAAQISIGEQIPEFDYYSPKTYTIGGITVSGVDYLDNSVLISISGLRVGDKIELPGDKTHTAITKLWDQGLFEDIEIKVIRVQDDQVFLNLSLKERPRMQRFSFKGVRKGEADDLREKVKLVSGDVVTDNLIIRTKNLIRKHYIGKGFWDVDVDIDQVHDTSQPNYVALVINVHKHNKVRIQKININGNEILSDGSLKASMKKTKEKGSYRVLYAIQEGLGIMVNDAFSGSLKKIPADLRDMTDANVKPRIFKASKLIANDYEEDKINLITKYNQAGYRDATILRDSVYKNAGGNLVVDLDVYEGHKYYFRNISFVGNTKYTASDLNTILGIRKGDIYNQEQLDAAISFNPNGFDLMSLYLDDGYLMAQVNPVEMQAENDSIDLEIRIHEGKQMRINKVNISGNTRTNDNVIIREIYSRPGQLFSRSDVIRSRTSLAQMKYFDPEKIDITTPNPNPIDGTVDVAYKVEETSSDQLELSGGWGYSRLIGTLGVSFNNFSAKNIFTKGAWRPVPSGDGQKLSIRMQSYGKGYLSFSTSFTEPWLGGKKPNAFSVSAYASRYSYGTKGSSSYYLYNITGLSFMLSRRLNWPDNYFTLANSINFQLYRLENYSRFTQLGIGDGFYQNYSYTIALGRYSTDAAIFARSGSEVSLSIEATPPYSLLFRDKYAGMTFEEKNKLVEFHQWKFAGTFYKQIVGDLVVMARVKAGFLGRYNPDMNYTPFNRYFMGGDGMTGYSSAIDGRQLIGFRGYVNESLTPDAYSSTEPGAIIFNKSTLELRYPLSLNPNSTIFGLVFAEAGNSWDNYKEFNPFDVKRSLGVGVRVFLPMFGLLGLDWGYGFDQIPGMSSANKGQFHFSINSSID
ncbi:MAG TPA: POTRA domain-containing protein [Bacteroidales bacterium]|nr:POTRA domain-containing protein [Bacteroidales bacterium]HPT01316.1 POTRA domain-containing protein [Bacteroidales bacterium]